ncbi:MAG TPA: PIN domain-containing protein [Solirubrobacteraceae bacterium]
MTLKAVLDANVLYPLPLRDTLLRIAAADLYIPRWSERILQEAARNLIGDGRASEEQAQRMTDAMCEAFDAAMVPAPEIERLEPQMTNEHKDRHVLAAAVVTEAEMIVTLNLRDFPRSSCAPLSIEVVHPDEFLLHLRQLDPVAVYDALVRQAAALTRPPLTALDILDRLDATVPEFAKAVRKDMV